ncbi:MAG: gas vesicle protein GvpD P-loop domain-containing protein [Candidatus Asgardarchaeia archaeon]
MESGTYLKLPSEFFQFLLKRKGYKIMIKGEPGTGKTVLAINLASMFSDSSKVIYLTSMVTSEELSIDYPIIKEYLNKVSLLDGSMSIRPVTHEEAKSFKYTERTRFLRALYDEVKGRKEPIYVIVDSIDELKYNLGLREEDITLERALFDLCREMNMRLILISERSGTNRLDYMVDAILELTRFYIGSNVIRKLIIKKMRGVTLKTHTFLFTLKNANFRVLTPQNSSIYEFLKRMKLSYKPILKNDVLSTGIPELDAALGGGYRIPSFNTIELVREIGTLYDYVYLPTLINHVASGKKVWFVSSFPINVEEFKKSLRPLFKESDSNLLEVIRVSDKESAFKLRDEISRRINEGDLMIIDDSGLREFLGSIFKDTLREILDVTNEMGSVVVYITRRIKDRVNMIGMVDTYLRVHRMYGVVLIEGVIPKTTFLYPYIEVKNGRLISKMDEVV